MINRRYQGFVSSTYEDLKEERKEVTQALLENNCFPAGMELFPASNKSQWEIIKKVIDESDFYIVIITGRYGCVGIDESGNEVSYTEMEFDYALKQQKPIIAFVHGNIDGLPRNKCELGVKQNKRLEEFRKKVKEGRLVKFWEDRGSLRAAVENAVSNLIHDEDNKMKGWISARDLEGMIDENVNKLNMEKQDAPLVIKLHKILEELYLATQAYRDALREGDQQLFDIARNELQQKTYTVFYLYERHNKTNIKVSKIAKDVFEAYNKFVEAVNRLSKIKDKRGSEFRQYTILADKCFNDFKELILEGIQKLEANC